MAPARPDAAGVHGYDRQVLSQSGSSGRRRIAMTDHAKRKEFSVPGLNPPISHYCDAVQFGNLLFVSGIGPLDAKLNVVGGDDVMAQAEAVFSAMEKVLKAAGASFADVLKVTVV